MFIQITMGRLRNGFPSARQITKSGLSPKELNCVAVSTYRQAHGSLSMWKATNALIPGCIYNREVLLRLRGKQ